MKRLNNDVNRLKEGPPTKKREFEKNLLTVEKAESILRDTKKIAEQARGPGSLFFEDLERGAAKIETIINDVKGNPSLNVILCGIPGRGKTYFLLRLLGLDPSQTQFGLVSSSGSSAVTRGIKKIVIYDPREEIESPQVKVRPVFLNDQDVEQITKAADMEGVHIEDITKQPTHLKEETFPIEDSHKKVLDFISELEEHPRLFYTEIRLPKSACPSDLDITKITFWDTPGYPDQGLLPSMIFKIRRLTSRYGDVLALLAYDREASYIQSNLEALRGNMLKSILPHIMLISTGVVANFFLHYQLKFLNKQTNKQTKKCLEKPRRPSLRTDPGNQGVR